jgi:hypothetical protein
MKRAVLIVAAAALCIAGSAAAQERNGLIGSGTRSEDSGQVAGSGNAAGQTVGSGGFTTSAPDQMMGSGARIESSGQVMGSGGRAEDSGQVVGSGSSMTSQDGGYLIGDSRAGHYGSGLSVRQLRLLDGSSLQVVSLDEGMFVILIEEKAR